MKTILTQAKVQKMLEQSGYSLYAYCPIFGDNGIKVIGSLRGKVRTSSGIPIRFKQVQSLSDGNGKVLYQRGGGQ